MTGRPTPGHAIRSKDRETAMSPIDPLSLVVRNLEEAETLAPGFGSVISLVDSSSPQMLHHKHRCFVPFDDVVFASDDGAPTLRDIRTILRFSESAAETLLVHCLYGQSRSTAVALGVLAARGVEPVVAYRALRDSHPPRRPFIPNVLVLALFDRELALGGALIEAGSAWCDEGIDSWGWFTQ